MRYICSSCGSKYSSDDKYCPICGKRVETRRKNQSSTKKKRIKPRYNTERSKAPNYYPPPPTPTHYPAPYPPYQDQYQNQNPAPPSQYYSPPRPASAPAPPPYSPKSKTRSKSSTSSRSSHSSISPENQTRSRQNGYPQKDQRPAPEYTRSQEEYRWWYNPYYYPPYPYYYPPYRRSTDAKHILAGIVVLPSYIFIGIMIAINLIMLAIGLGIVYPELLVNEVIIAFPYPWPNYVSSFMISGFNSAAWYLFVVISIVLSVIWLVYTEGKDFLRIFVNSFKKFHPPPSKTNNSFVIIAQIFFTLLFFQVLIVIFMALFGFQIPLPEPEMQPQLWENFFYLANASVAEEIFTRTLYIGLPLLVFDVIVRRKTKKIHRYFVGGEFKIEHITIILIFFSAVLFGLAHVPGWGLWKFFPTFVAGLGFGYLFVKKGIHTAIILHFLIDYMAVTLLFFEGTALVLLFGSLLVIMMLAWIGSGLIYFVIYTMDIFKQIWKILIGEDFIPQPQDPMASSSGVGYGTSSSLSSDNLAYDRDYRNYREERGKEREREKDRERYKDTYRDRDQDRIKDKRKVISGASDVNYEKYERTEIPKHYYQYPQNYYQYPYNYYQYPYPYTPPYPYYDPYDPYWRSYYDQQHSPYHNKDHKEHHRKRKQ